MDGSHHIRDSLEPFSRKNKTIICFQTPFENSAYFQTEFKKYPLGPGSWALARASWAPAWRIFFQIECEHRPFFSKSFEHGLLVSNFFENARPGRFSKMSRIHVFNVSPLMGDASYHMRVTVLAMTAAKPQLKEMVQNVWQPSATEYARRSLAVTSPPGGLTLALHAPATNN